MDIKKLLDQMERVSYECGVNTDYWISVQRDLIIALVHYIDEYKKYYNLVVKLEDILPSLDEFDENGDGGLEILDIEFGKLKNNFSDGDSYKFYERFKVAPEKIQKNILMNLSATVYKFVKP